MNKPDLKIVNDADLSRYMTDNRFTVSRRVKKYKALIYRIEEFARQECDKFIEYENRD